MDRFEQGASKNMLDEDFESLINSLKQEISVSKEIKDHAVSYINDESNYVVNDIPDMLFKEGNSLNNIKNIYIKELITLNLKQAIASKLVEKEIYKQ